VGVSEDPSGLKELYGRFGREVEVHSEIDLMAINSGKKPATQLEGIQNSRGYLSTIDSI
jgi:hypothetical protein